MVVRVPSGPVANEPYHSTRETTAVGPPASQAPRRVKGWYQVQSKEYQVVIDDQVERSR